MINLNRAPFEPDIPTPNRTPQRGAIFGVVAFILLCFSAGFFLLGHDTENEPAQTQATTALNTVGGNDGGLKIPADGQPVFVTGNDNVVVVTGDCPRLNVGGKNNYIDIEAVGEIVVSGSANTVRWSAGRNGDTPTVKTTGNANTVAHGSD